VSSSPLRIRAAPAATRDCPKEWSLRRGENKFVRCYTEGSCCTAGLDVEISIRKDSRGRLIVAMMCGKCGGGLWEGKRGGNPYDSLSRSASLFPLATSFCRPSCIMCAHERTGASSSCGILTPHPSRIPSMPTRVSDNWLEDSDMYDACEEDSAAQNLNYWARWRGGDVDAYLADTSAVSSRPRCVSFKSGCHGIQNRFEFQGGNCLH
jgi:hypothetical protein